MGTEQRPFHLVGGLDVWFSAWTPVAWAGSRPIYWDFASLIVLHHDHQLMIMKCAIPGLGNYIMIVNAHAPHSGNEDSCKNQWRQRFSHLLRVHCRNLPVILLIDANAQVGSVPCEGIGEVHGCMAVLDGLALSCPTSNLPPPVKMGRSSKPGGYYNTAELKEYPAQLCKF